jgi:putative CocE/NonD family hydrolase
MRLVSLAVVLITVTVAEPVRSVSCCTAAIDPTVETTDSWTVEREVSVPMRDGVHLSTTIIRPKGMSKKLPSILLRTPYDDTSKLFPAAFGLGNYVKNGYAVVLQDTRGRGFSEGYYDDYMQGATTDGYDTIDWVVNQPWSNGKVGSIGCSVSGDDELLMAAGSHPGHAAMIPAATSAIHQLPGDETQGAFYRGGVPAIGVWAGWYSFAAPGERLLVPPNSTQDERVRLRNSYSVQTFWQKLYAPRDLSDPSRLSILMHLPSKDILRAMDVALTPFDKYITWTPEDQRWNKIELFGGAANPRVPALHMSSWHDPWVGETTRLFRYLQDRGTSNQYLIIGAGPHCSYFSNNNASDMKFGDLEVGDARYRGDDEGYSRLFMDWFDFWLKGQQNHVTSMPKVQLYVMGLGWISSDQWPLKEARSTNYYLHAASSSADLNETGGALSASEPEGDSQDTYLYDPASPTPSRGGDMEEKDAARDQRPIEVRKDVLLYSTPPLRHPLTVAGSIQVVLYVSSTAKDTDFMAKLVDVYPDGKAINLTDTAFRARYREGFDKKVLMERGKVYKITLSNMLTAVRFPVGHRIRVDISSSNFPEYERNLNTGGNNYDEKVGVVAENSIHTGSHYPSHIVLPELPESSER